MPRINDEEDAYRLVQRAINSPAHNSGESLGRWIQGHQLNEYRKDYKTEFGYVHGGPDWAKYSQELIKGGKLLKYERKDRSRSDAVFFVLPQFKIRFESRYGKKFQKVTY